MCISCKLLFNRTQNGHPMKLFCNFSISFFVARPIYTILRALVPCIFCAFFHFFSAAEIPIVQAIGGQKNDVIVSGVSSILVSDGGWDRIEVKIF